LCKRDCRSVSDSMRNYPFTPEKIFVEEAACRYPLAASILAHFRPAGIPVTYISEGEQPALEGLKIAGRIIQSKRYLALRIRKGVFVKPFRSGYRKGTFSEYYIAHAENCPCDCHYCYLQTYFESFVPTIFVNTEKMFCEIEKVVTGLKGPSYFHAGHTADSFLLHEATGVPAKLVELFAGHQDATLELRTKSAQIGLPPIRENRNIIVSWTILPQKHIEMFETNTPALCERLRAAAACAFRGYKIGIRMDPIILYGNWQTYYNDAIAELSKALDESSVESFVLGAFRYYGKMKEVIRSRFPASPLLLDEFVPCADGKYRYLKAKRIALYQKLKALIRKRYRYCPIHLCMETPEVEKRFA